MSALIDNLSRDELLDIFQAKAGCMHSQHKANAAWRLLRKHLTEKQLGELITAWGHHRDVGLGRAELDEACDEVRKAWRGLDAMSGFGDGP